MLLMLLLLESGQLLEVLEIDDRSVLEVWLLLVAEVRLLLLVQLLMILLLLLLLLAARWCWWFVMLPRVR